MKKPIPLPIGVLIVGLMLILFFPLTSSGQNPVGNCQDPIIIDDILNGAPQDFSTSTASVDLLANDCANTSEFKLWFRFTALGTDLNLDGNCIDNHCKVSLLQFDNDPCNFSTATSIKCNDTGISLNLTNVLSPGETYYLVYTVDNLDGFLQIAINNPPINANDEICNAALVVPDGSCLIGSTNFTTEDFINANTNCDESLFAQSVWYKTSLSLGKTTLDIELSSLSLSGDVAVLVGTLSTCEDDSLILEKYYCGTPNGFSVFGLTSGQEYYIGISTSEDEAGDFAICTFERSPPIGCAQNNDCQSGHNGPQEIIIAANPYPTCIEGCNIGASPGKNFGGTSCFDAYGPTVWYSYKAKYDRILQLSIYNSELSNPQMAIYVSYDCENFSLINCTNTGFLYTQVYEYNEYLIAVSGTNEEEGEFQLCAELDLDGTHCNEYSNIRVTNTSKGSPLDGPFLPGENVDICLEIHYFNSAVNSCQWLHGIVPEFGEGWDASSFDNDGSPINITQPLFPIFNNQAMWNWYPYGFVNYNNVQPFYIYPGEPVGAGWFVTGVINQNPTPCDPFYDPSCSWGDGAGCGDFAGGGWQVCFQLTTVSNECSADPSLKDCSISFRTFGDGETGSWTSPGCQTDLPWYKEMKVSCCDDPCGECPAEGLDFSNEWISKVSFSNFTNESDAAGYSDFTDQIIELQPGTSNYFSLEAGFSDQHFNEYWKIWIDFNEDGDFKDAGEELFSRSSNAASLNGSFDLPFNLSGSRKMRIAMSYDAPPLPCSKFAFGEVEDYTIQFDDCRATVPSKVEYLGDDVKISWETIPQASLYYFVYREQGTGTWMASTTANEFILLTELEPGKRYDYHIRTQCPNGWTNWSQRYYFMTDPDICFVPSPVDIAVLPDNALLIQLNSISIANNYRIRYRIVDTDDWIELVSASELITISNILPNQTYEYQVAALCQNGWTNYSANHHFTLDGIINREPENETISSTHFSIMPNPSDGNIKLQFSATTANHRIELFSLDGKKIEQYEIVNTDEKQLDLTHLSAGIYFIRWHNQNQTQTKKLIISR